MGKGLIFLETIGNVREKELRQTPKGMSEDQCQRAVSGAFVLA
jgi:hypothetical protein